MNSTFDESAFNQSINDWDISSVKWMVCMFEKSWFNQQLDNWDLKGVECTVKMFADMHVPIAINRVGQHKDLTESMLTHAPYLNMHIYK